MTQQPDAATCPQHTASWVLKLPLLPPLLLWGPMCVQATAMLYRL